MSIKTVLRVFGGLHPTNSSPQNPLVLAKAHRHPLLFKIKAAGYDTLNNIFATGKRPLSEYRDNAREEEMAQVALNMLSHMHLILADIESITQQTATDGESNSDELSPADMEPTTPLISTEVVTTTQQTTTPPKPILVLHKNYNQGYMICYHDRKLLLYSKSPRLVHYDEDFLTGRKHTLVNNVEVSAIKDYLYNIINGMRNKDFVIKKLAAMPREKQQRIINHLKLETLNTIYQTVTIYITQQNDKANQTDKQPKTNNRYKTLASLLAANIALKESDSSSRQTFTHHEMREATDTAIDYLQELQKLLSYNEQQFMEMLKKTSWDKGMVDGLQSLLAYYLNRANEDHTVCRLIIIISHIVSSGSDGQYAELLSTEITAYTSRRLDKHENNSIIAALMSYVVNNAEYKTNALRNARAMLYLELMKKNYACETTWLNNQTLVAVYEKICDADDLDIENKRQMLKQLGGVFHERLLAIIKATNRDKELQSKIEALNK